MIAVSRLPPAVSQADRNAQLAAIARRVKHLAKLATAVAREQFPVQRVLQEAAPTSHSGKKLIIKLPKARRGIPVPS